MSERRFAGYIRQSRQKRNGDAVSPKQQRDAIELAAEHYGVRVTQWYEDINVSGAKTSRPEFNRMVEAIAHGEVQGAIIAKFDRLSRAGLVGTVKLIEAIESAGGQWFAADRLGIDPKSREGELLLTMDVGIARYIWRGTAEDMQDAKLRGARRGAWLNGQAPIGYGIAKSRDGGDGRLRIHPKEGPLVTEIFRRVAADGLDQTLDWLGREKGHGADPARRWTRAWLVRLVRRRAYLGETEWNRRDERGKVVETIRAEDAHDPLTDLVTWTRANRRADGIDVSERAPRASYPLSGVAVCAHCGAPMRGSISGGKYRLPNGRVVNDKPKAGEYEYVPGPPAYKSGCEHHTYVGRAAELEALARSLMVDYAAEFGNDPGEDIPGTPGDADAAQLRTELESAKLARQADIDNLALPPDALTARVAAHDRRIAELERAYGDAVEAAAPDRLPVEADAVREASPIELARMLRTWGLRVAVLPQPERPSTQLPLGERAALVEAAERS